MNKQKTPKSRITAFAGIKSTKKKNLERLKKEIVCSQIKQSITSSIEVDEDLYQPSEGLFEEKNDIPGNDIFRVTLLTPKPVKALSKSKLLVKSGSKSAPAKTKSISKSTGKTSTEKAGYNLRCRMKQELARMRDETADTDPEDSNENSSWDDESESDVEESQDSGTTFICKSAKMKRGKGTNSTFAESYFFAHKQSKATTSNRTMSNIKLKPMNVRELDKILHNIPEYHSAQKLTLFQKYYSLFGKWMFLIHQGFNILLYGVGSKQKILNTFCSKHLQDSVYITIHGFFPSLNIKQILCSISEEALEHDGKFPNIYEHTEFIKNHLSSSKEELYIVVHSIDGKALRSVKTQMVLASLASSPNIHFIVSVDHINCSLIWDQIMLNQFKWIWFNITTFEPYTIETSYENALLKDQSTHLLLSSVLHVFNSLTPNSQGVFLILARQQHEAKGNAANTGMTFQEWYQECREAFLVNSELTMQAQLSEFKNHKLLASRKASDGIEYWYIPVDESTLEQFLDSCQ